MRILFFCLFLVGCAHGGSNPGRMPQSTDTKSVVAVEARNGSRVSGVVNFEMTAAGVVVRAEVKGLKPGSEHGFHIHEFGDCTAVDASSAGSHFNPMQKPHGGVAGDMRHVGDLENLVADKKGVAKYERTFSEASLPFSQITGRAVVVHEKIDDLKSQPAGDAGKRIGCGVIGIAKAI